MAAPPVGFSTPMSSRSPKWDHEWSCWSRFRFERLSRDRPRRILLTHRVLNMIRRLDFDRDKIEAWLRDESDEGGGYWFELLARGFILNNNLVSDIVGDVGTYPGRGHTFPFIYQEVTPGERPEWLVAVGEVAPGAWLSSAPFTVGDVLPHVGESVGAEAVMVVLDYVFDRINTTIDAFNGR